MNHDKDFYSSIEVADHLSIKTSTLRKYSILLENYNYVINRDYANNRIYSEVDIKMLKDLQSLREKFTLAEAAELLTKELQGKQEKSNFEDLVDRVAELEEKYEDLNGKLEKVLELQDYTIKMFEHMKSRLT